MLLWSTDIHLDFLHPTHPAYQSWIRDLKSQVSEGILLTGDLANGPTLVTWLEQLAQDLQKPIYFILGNHVGKSSNSSLSTLYCY